MISITKQLKAATEPHHAAGTPKQLGKARWGRWAGRRRLGSNAAPIQLLLLLKVLAAVALMPSATAATTTLLSLISTTAATAPTATTMANDIKAYETTKPAGVAVAGTATHAPTAAVDAPTDSTALKTNTAVSRHAAATASTSNSKATTTYIKRNIRTNMTTKQGKSGGSENIAASNPTAAFTASTIATTTSPTTAQATTPGTTNTKQQQLFEAEADTTTATSCNVSSSPDDLIRLGSTPPPLEPAPAPWPPNSSNMSFHQHCVSSRDSFADLITIVLYTVVCVVGLFGNTLVIYVVLRFSKMQTVTNIYILNLAIADECFLIGIPFLLYTMRICSWTFGEYICKAYMVSTSITQFTSSIFLLIMSADRFIAVCHPIASPRYRTLHIAKYVSALAWLTSAVLMLPVILFASTVAQEDGIHYSCNIDWPERYEKHSGTTFILYNFFLGFATPLCFILSFYYLVIKKLHAVGRKHKSKEKKRSHRKVTRLVLTVITVYILCWLPQWISQVALISSNPGQRDLSRIEVLVFLLIGCLAYSNSAMNPILYAFLSDNFRKSFSKAFTCMAGHEVNAQLQVEPSVFTKHGGSRRRSSKRLVAQATTKTKATLHANPTLGNNNSSTTTSSTATQNERNIVAVSGASMGAAMSSTTTTTLTTSTGNSGNLAVPPFHASTNGRVSVSTEDVMLVLDKEEGVCATVFERRKSVRHSNAGSTLQTDL